MGQALRWLAAVLIVFGLLFAACGKILLQRSMGRRVTLTCKEHLGVPTACFAETRYFVHDVRIIEDPAPLAPPPQPAAQPFAVPKPRQK